MSAKKRPLMPRSAATPAFPLVLVVPLASVVAGGEPVRAQEAVGPALILEDSVVLQETQDAYVGQPVEMFLGNDGSLFVIDGFSNNVVRFDQSGGAGRYVRTAGPRPGGVFLHRLRWVRPRDPGSLGKVATSDIVTAVTAHGGKLWVGGASTDEWKGVGVKSLRALPGGEVALDRVPIPKPYSESQLLLWVGGFARLHAGDADLLCRIHGKPISNARRLRRRRRYLQRLVVADEPVQKRRLCLHRSPGQRASRPARRRQALGQQPARRRREAVSRHPRAQRRTRGGPSRRFGVRPSSSWTKGSTTTSPTVCGPSCGGSRWSPPSARAKSEAGGRQRGSARRRRAGP